MNNSLLKVPLVTVLPTDRIEIGIPSRGRNLNLVSLLQALRTQTFQNWDLTIVDDNPDDSMKNCFSLHTTIKLLEIEGHRVRVLEGPHTGLIFAQNILLTACRKKVMARLDDDIIPQPDFIEKLMHHFYHDTDQRLIAVGGSIPQIATNQAKDYQLPPQSELLGYAPFEYPEFRYVHPTGAQPKRVNSLYSSFCYKTEVFKYAGGFSHSYSPIAEKEDTDICLRSASLGGRLIFEPRALAWHLKAPMGGIRNVTTEQRQVFFHEDTLNFRKRANQIRLRVFDYALERKTNLENYVNWLGLEDHQSGYIPPPISSAA